MAGGGSLYNDDDNAAITDINVTPFVDVVLVLLVVFMVTAKLIISRGLEIDPPKGPGGAVTAQLKVTVDTTGYIDVNGLKLQGDDVKIAKIKEVASTLEKPKAIITGDPTVQYEGVMKAISLVKKADKNIGIALETKPEQ